MFEVLVASGAHLDLRPRWMTTSVATHGLLVVLAPGTTGKALDSRAPAVADPPMLLFEDAARATVLGGAFRPARLRARPVRELTRQSIRFVATS